MVHIPTRTLYIGSLKARWVSASVAQQSVSTRFSMAAGEGAAAPPSEKEGSSKKSTPSTPPHVRALAGSLGGIVEACCLQPIDVIKTRLQLDRTGAYRGIVHCGATAVRTEGVRALWKGLTPFATHLTLKYALRMGSNALLQSAFKDATTGHLSNRGRIAAGFGAGVIEALVIVTPFEVSRPTANSIT